MSAPDQSWQSLLKSSQAFILVQPYILIYNAWNYLVAGRQHCLCVYDYMGVCTWSLRIRNKNKIKVNPCIHPICLIGPIAYGFLWIKSLMFMTFHESFVNLSHVIHLKAKLSSLANGWLALRILKYKVVLILFKLFFID